MMNLNVTRRNIVKLAAAVALVMGIGSASGTRADAGFVPDVWNAIFGPAGTPYFASYRGGYYPGYTTGYRYGAYYSPGVFGYRSCYAPVCNPCNPCGLSTCNPCSPCGVGNPCKVTSAGKTGDKLKPEKDPIGRTFKEDGQEAPPKPKDGAGDSKFNKRDDSGKFEPARKKEDGAPPGEGEAKDGKREAFKGQNNLKDVPPSLIKKKVPAPTKSAKGDSDENDPSEKKSKESEKSKSPSGPKVYRLNFDEKITWRAAPKRTRLIIRSNVAVPTVARIKVNTNKNWTPVARGTRIVRK